MVFQTVLNLSTNNRRETLSQSIFTVIFLSIIIGWIVVALWTRVIDNFSFEVLGLSDSSSWDTFLIALFVSIAFITLIWVVDRYNIVPGGVDPSIEADEPFPTQQAFISTVGSANFASIPALFPGVVFR